MGWKNIPLWLRWGLVSVFAYIVSVGLLSLSLSIHDPIIEKNFFETLFYSLDDYVYDITLIIVSISSFFLIPFINNEYIFKYNMAFTLTTLGYILVSLIIFAIFSRIGWLVQRKRNKKLPTKFNNYSKTT